MIYIFKLIKYLLLIVSGMIILALLVFLSPPLWRYLVTYPGLDKEVENLWKLRKEQPAFAGLNLYRGVIHAHSYWSHDSEGTLHGLIPAAKTNGIDFIFLTDHPHGQTDTFPRGYNGFYDGILIVPGSEKEGFVTWPPGSVIIDWKVDKDTISANITKQGGLLFYSHTEEPHNWGNPFYQGMEIYNIHTDGKDESLLPFIINMTVNGGKYYRWAFRELFDEQTAILALWDSLNLTRKIIGFSAVDTHENMNFRARYLKDGRIEWVGPNANVIDTMEVKFRNKWLFSEPDADGWVFKWMIDTYRGGFDYITNYVFADTLNFPSLTDHLKKGHLYTAFKSLGDATGFLFSSLNSEGEPTGILGDSVHFSKVKTLHSVSPLPGRFVLKHDGKTLEVTSGDDYQYSWSGPIGKGVYRIEIHLRISGKYVPWLYSNPIYIY